MYLIDERWRRRAGQGVAQASTLALVPLLQAHTTACPLFRLAVVALSLVFVVLVRCLAARLRQEIVASDQRVVREATGDGVENAWPDRHTRHAEVVAVQQVIGGHIVQAAHRIRPAPAIV